MTKAYDLEERTLRFAKQVRAFVKKLPKTISNIEDGKQLITKRAIGRGRRTYDDFWFYYEKVRIMF